MNILIIGSEGFIGSHAIDFFGIKNNVWGVDISGPTNSIKNYIRVDKNIPDYNHIFEEHKFDVCINASGNGSVPVSLNKPLFDFELNTYNTIKILDAIRIYNPDCKFINLSSAAVYGNPNTLPISEESILKPLSPYGWHKLYSENICKEYFYLFNIKTINLRLFSVYGENLRKQLFWDIYQKCLHSKTIELFGTGDETRDFIHVNDLIAAIDQIIKKGLFNGEAINISSGIETSIAFAANVFTIAIDNSIKINFNNIAKPGDPLNWKADISKLKSYGFNPKIDIENGLKNLGKWIKENK
jgi:dTDP-glucose 4,6-dehydratase/UDP-glucose 4-epimerase